MKQFLFSSEPQIISYYKGRDQILQGLMERFGEETEPDPAHAHRKVQGPCQRNFLLTFPLASQHQTPANDNVNLSGTILHCQPYFSQFGL